VRLPARECRAGFFAESLPLIHVSPQPFGNTRRFLTVSISPATKGAVMKTLLISTIAGGMLLGACTSSGTAERNAVYGAAAGAAAGAVAGEVIAGKPGKGALIGAGVGAVGGAIAGCARADDCFGRARDHDDRRHDDYANRYYYVDPATGDTWWENGEFRSYGPGRP
jgi:hypothetical protein